MSIINTRIMGYPGNWFRVGLMLFLFFSGLAIASGQITNPVTEQEE